MGPRLDYMAAAPGAVKAMYGLEAYLAGCGLEKSIRELVKLRASQINGCAFCIDMHWSDLIKLGEDPRQLNAVTGWREAPFFTERERAALRWAELVTNTPHSDASDDEFAKLREHFSDEEIAELSFVIVTINSWNLLNVSLRNPVPLKAPHVAAA